MQSRREFIRRAAYLTGAAGLWSGLPDSIQRAVAIAPEQGTSWRDAEHVVILMQENRSFDHTFGTLKGVRGFNDPRAIRLPDGNPVWAQATEKGERHVPFRLNLMDSNSTWMGCLPHNWTDQVDAANKGRHDRWLQVKQSGTRAYAHMPLTMGYYTRQDIPFYYALADAFTVCDQHFCSTLTGTTPNRLHLWTGTIRAQPTPTSHANVLNSDVDHGAWANWTTFPERLEDAGVSWKIYQNELTIESGLTEDEDNWLANFGDNPIEYFSQYHVRHAENHRGYVAKRVQEIPAEVSALQMELAGQTGAAAAKTGKRISELTQKLKQYEMELREFTPEHFNQLSPREKQLHARAFVTNTGDPEYRRLVEVDYRDGGVARKMQVPKGDILHQFRQDVASGQLPTVSWLVSPAKFSDHPSSAWFGAWYISEALDILTKNPAVWKKTVFILTYDENDGYFDHVPPFQVPHPRRPETGLVTPGIDAAVEYVEFEQDRKRKTASQARDNAMGLGFRVPMIIASPWSRGGCVCSQVFDHTSVLQFLEVLLGHKTGKKIQEANITQWRRSICGDLTSAFQTAGGEKVDALPFLQRDAYVEAINRAKFKEPPSGFAALTNAEIDGIRRSPTTAPRLPRQEPGMRRSCPLPYEHWVDAAWNGDRSRLLIRFAATKERRGTKLAGAPFIVYDFSTTALSVRHYAVEAGQQLEDAWTSKDFPEGRYHFRVHGPNGFYREFTGWVDEPQVTVQLRLEETMSQLPASAGTLACHLQNHSAIQSYSLELIDNAYDRKNKPTLINLAAKKQTPMIHDTASSYGWYDFSVKVSGVNSFVRRYAGRVETGQWSWTDPLMGGVEGG